MLELVNELSHEVVTQYDLLRDRCGIVDLPSLKLATLEGEDRKGWLQGQATNNLRSMDEGASIGFCLCEPTGQILAVCDLWSVSDRFLLSMPSGAIDSFLRRAEDMVIVEDVVAGDVTKQFQLLSIQGPSATAELGRLMSLPSLDAGQVEFEGAEIFALRSNRTGLGGWDLWIPARSRKAKKRLESEFKTIGSEAYEIARIESGIPSATQDYGVKTLPPELGPAFESQYVSYSKGCYTGQEVLMRIHSRGHTNRCWVGLMADSPLTVGTTLASVSNPNVGFVTSAAVSPDFGPIGAAMLRSEVAENGERLIARTESQDIEVEVRRMPILRTE